MHWLGIQAEPLPVFNHNHNLAIWLHLYKGARRYGIFAVFSPMHSHDNVTRDQARASNERLLSAKWVCFMLNVKQYSFGIVSSPAFSVF